MWKKLFLDVNNEINYLILKSSIAFKNAIIYCFETIRLMQIFFLYYNTFFVQKKTTIKRSIITIQSNIWKGLKSMVSNFRNISSILMSRKIKKNDKFFFSDSQAFVFCKIMSNFMSVLFLWKAVGILATICSISKILKQKQHSQLFEKYIFAEIAWSIQAWIKKII